MLIKRILPAALVIAAAAAPAAHAAQQHYRLVVAGGSERVAFSGTPAAACASQATCGTSGTVIYKFGGTPSHARALLTNSHGKVTRIDGRFATSGRTRARVTVPGRSNPCTDTVAHHEDGFLLRAKGSELAFAPHRGRTDYLATSCAGPLEAHLAKIGALPAATFKPSSFAHPNFRFSLTGSHKFVQDGFAGTLRWTLQYRLVSG